MGVKDTARTSTLARVASEALRQLQEEPVVRDDRVARFKHFASDDFKLSDDAIDTIFSRLFAV
jgi:hypothetical protein